MSHSCRKKIGMKFYMLAAFLYVFYLSCLTSYMLCVGHHPYNSTAANRSSVVEVKRICLNSKPAVIVD